MEKYTGSSGEIEMPEPKTPEEVLRFTVLKFKELGMLAEDAEYKYETLRGEAVELFRRRARIVRDLPNRIKMARSEGYFPEVEMRSLKIFSDLAKEALQKSESEDASVQPLKNLLSNDLSPNKQNDLDIFLNRIYPSGDTPYTATKKAPRRLNFTIL